MNLYDVHASFIWEDETYSDRNEHLYVLASSEDAARYAVQLHASNIISKTRFVLNSGVYRPLRKKAEIHFIQELSLIKGE